MFAEASPLSPFSHTYRFSKLSTKTDHAWHDQVEPFVFRATQASPTDTITACLYYNDAWVQLLPDFMNRWQGPVSLVYEVLGTKNATSRETLLRRLAAMREEHPLIRQHVDIHVVHTPQASEFQHARARERLITRPIGTIFHLNMARFFARTDLVWLVSDARVLPAIELGAQLQASAKVRDLALERMDAIVVPVFGAHRKGITPRALSDLAQTREDIGLVKRLDGVAEEEFEELSAGHISAYHNSLPSDASDWPATRDELLAAVGGDRFGLYDRHWDAGKGPTDFQAWRNASARSIPAGEGNSPDVLQMDAAFYRITGYDLHYSPSLVVGKSQQPWCTERFEYSRAVCSYQMYLQGAKLWVLSSQWAYTLESIDKGDKPQKNEADRLKSAIAGRLYSKFHTEACMHYGRAFLSMDLWDSERAQQLRYSCSQVLKSNGMGKGR